MTKKFLALNYQQTELCGPVNRLALAVNHEMKKSYAKDDEINLNGTAQQNKRSMV